MHFNEQSPTLHPATDIRLQGAIDRLTLVLHCAAGVLALLVAWAMG
ncbi:hypothetical protein JI739_09730 [Ramlibacter sp. AW1]|uniref:Uncharacterized protein n=1 Tax=Ramlibacter aurantiacus TaxID=2801330 RepID=A0A937D4S8_9BURK|nr:hypothetical protein [Ramlibacter aurantiacus]MBL0420622.1 hypothetical protein [Ramlibacter aurantiacus]